MSPFNRVQSLYWILLQLAVLVSSIELARDVAEGESRCGKHGDSLVGLALDIGDDILDCYVLNNNFVAHGEGHCFGVAADVHLHTILQLVSDGLDHCQETLHRKSHALGLADRNGELRDVILGKEDVAEVWGAILSSESLGYNVARSCVALATSIVMNMD